ncbi:MAG: hypothetical protein KME50_30450 [Nostoc desertorum CM1-VF14]|jgi:hypothetical protein|nr:hypothetical protein [Nostoc desertorum CM1-VF14]
MRYAGANASYKIGRSHYVFSDGAAHNLAEKNKMHQFHQYWDEKSGLKAFQKQLDNLLTEISSTL